MAEAFEPKIIAFACNWCAYGAADLAGVSRCHYLDGNVKAERMFALAKELTTILGIAPERLRLEWVSSAEGTRFAEIAREFTEEIRTLGPLGLRQAA